MVFGLRSIVFNVLVWCVDCALFLRWNTSINYLILRMFIKISTYEWKNQMKNSFIFEYTSFDVYLFNIFLCVF